MAGDYEVIILYLLFTCLYFECIIIPFHSSTYNVLLQVFIHSLLLESKTSNIDIILLQDLNQDNFFVIMTFLPCFSCTSRPYTKQSPTGYSM